MKLRFIAAVLALLLVLGATASAEEGFAGFNVVIVGEDNDTNSLSMDDEDGLSVKLGSWSIAADWSDKTNDDAPFVWAYLDAQIMNWTLSTLNIAESLSAKLTYNGSYDFAGIPQYELASLGVLERLDGKLAFKIPLIVALAAPEELEVTIKSLNDEQTFPVDMVAAAAELDAGNFPFSYATAETDGLEFAVVEDAYVLPAYKGSYEEVARWLIQPVKLINWNSETIDLQADSLTGSLVYRGKYAFQGEYEYSKSSITPLEAIDVTLAVRIPVAVTEAGKNDTELWISSELSEYKDTFDMPAAVRNKYYAVQPVEGAARGFIYNDEGWYTSTNAGVSDSYSLCAVHFKFNGGGTLTIHYSNSGEGGYDFGVLSDLDKTLPLNNSADGAKYKLSNETNDVQYTVNDSAEHFIYIKYRKDGSNDKGSDCLRFQISMD